MPPRAWFDTAREVFVVQEGRSTENYTAKSVETINGVIYTLRYDTDNGKGNLVGLIIPDPNYAKKSCRTFRRPTRPRVYDNELDVDKLTISTQRAEAKHKANIEDWNLCDTAEEEYSDFISDSIEDMWLAELKKKITIYGETKTIKMIDHLHKTCLGTHEIDISELQDQMREFPSR